jgi:hydrogenase maturation protein HypF
MLAADGVDSIYDYQWETGDGYRILPAPIIRGVIRDIKSGVSTAEISAKFHGTLIRLFAHLCEVIRKEHGLDRVVLSGGVFQNSLLLSGLIQALENKHFKVFSHQLVPANDGGIALGQAVAAAAGISS